VRVAVVDLQGQVEVLGQGDVRSEGLTLSDSALFTGAEEIQSALSDGDGDVGVRPERLLQAGDRGLDRLGVVLLRTRSEPASIRALRPRVGAINSPSTWTGAESVSRMIASVPRRRVTRPSARAGSE